MKSNEIRELGKNDLTTGQIAELVGCDPAYVRVCLRQRVNGRPSKADRAYVEKHVKEHGHTPFMTRYYNSEELRQRHYKMTQRRHKERYETDLAYRLKHNENAKRWRENNRERVRENQRAWYAANRDKYCAKQRDYQRNKYATDLAYREFRKQRSRERYARLKAEAARA